MSFRTRLLLAFVLLGLVPLTVFALGIRKEMTDRLVEQDARRVEALVSVIEDDLGEQSRGVADRLAALGTRMRDDNRLRSAIVRARESAREARAGAVEMDDRAYLLDYAGEAMRTAGLSMLQIQDESGRILSSGHFRNEYDRAEPDLPRRLAAMSPGAALTRARSPEGDFLALVQSDSITLGGERLTLIGGVRIGRAFLDRLTRGHELGIRLSHPGGELASEPAGDAQVVGEVALGFIGTDAQGAEAPADSVRAGEARTDAEPTDAGPADAAATGAAPVEAASADAGRADAEPASATFVVTRSPEPLRALQRSVDLWFLLAIALTALAAVGTAGWLSRRLSRPLAELAARTDRLDLDRLDVDFESDRDDEVGTLSRVLGSMTGRLRESAMELREAERRATVGEMARQVNHDIRNGLTPIRNVIRHLTRVAWDAPEKLETTFLQRRDSLENSIDYLETLASNYARLSPKREAVRCDVNVVVRGSVDRARSPGWVRITTKLADRTPEVAADPVALRRVLQNLVTNAIESLEGNGGTVTVRTRVLTGADGEARGVELSVADTGRGIDPADRERIFEDFYTTREAGTGLGLSIVRRLVSDMGGRIRVESRPGLGSRFIVEIPAAGSEGDAGGEGGAGGENRR